MTSKDPYTKRLGPQPMVLLRGGGTFKRLGLSERSSSHWGHAFAGDCGIPASSFSSLLPDHEAYDFVPHNLP
jgi:hypothetical protein